MNCPLCHEQLGHDQHAAGPWADELDRQGRILGSLHDLYLFCGHCGMFLAVEDQAGRIRLIRGPIRDPRELRRLERLIPALRADKRLEFRRRRRPVAPIAPIPPMPPIPSRRRRRPSA